jgi:arylsulfatase
MSTFAEIAGATYPKIFNGHDVLPVEGRSLVPAWKGETMPPRTLFFEHEGNRAVREDRWKLVSLAGHPWELYDFENDRSELHDLSAQHPETAARLAAAWEQWAIRCHVRRPKPAESTNAPPALQKERED